MAWSDAARAAAAETRRRNKKLNPLQKQWNKMFPGAVARAAVRKRKAPKPGSDRALALHNKWMDNYAKQQSQAWRGKE